MNATKNAPANRITTATKPSLQTSNRKVFIASHLVYWPIYLTSLFILQAIHRTIRYYARNGVVSIIKTPLIIVNGIQHYSRLATPHERGLLLLRGSWVLTPSDVFPWMYHMKEIRAHREDERVEDKISDKDVAIKVARRDESTCTCCGDERTDDNDTLFDIDFVRPASRGGAPVEGNLRVLCRPCHDARHGGTMDT